ncbi:hypothetical protein PUR59_35125 [Streptomyces sp. SP18ES09]|uniref:hypothetical protein n=1 Tax=Streptomyces sp. SP18ES09 TaxID=3002532 RepID=UPI002E75EAC9|nr:hypothetical protein [Streptomyces sp. SP18ES09]MEE1820232.1 hypothetical protein [Streptomyces sp. SP18ES09]
MSASEKNDEKASGPGHSMTAPRGGIGVVGPHLPAPEECGDAVDERPPSEGRGIRDHKVLVCAGAVLAAAALGGAYVQWRRSGQRSRSPLSRLTAGRF